MKITSYLFLFLISIGAFPQSEKDIKPRNENFISSDLFSPFFETPRYRINFIKNINQKNKIGIELGYGHENISIFEAEKDYELFDIRSEYYRIINPKRKTLKYFSFELFYIHQSNEFINQTFRSSNNSYFSFDKADFTRQKIGFIPKFGMFVNLSKKIGINWYTGVGIRLRMNDYSNINNLSENDTFQEHFPPYYRNDGNMIGVEFTIGLKLYYRLKN